MSYRKARLALVGLLFACGGDDKKGSIFEPKPECQGEDVVPLSGQHQMVISKLEIGAESDGFDLDRDGTPDNQMSKIASLARGAIEDSFEEFSIIIPIEFFDYPANGPDQCVKFAFYLGAYQMDADGDGAETARDKGDCNDHDATIRRGMPEIAGNLKDDDCDKLADETDMDDGMGGTIVVPSDNMVDADGDGFSPHDGDCDDTNAMAHPGRAEICGDGYDNDCDGAGDWGRDQTTGKMVCSPFDDTPDLLKLDPLSFHANGDPVIEFNSGTTEQGADGVVLEAGPSIFSVSIPVYDDIALELRITGATIEATFAQGPSGLGLAQGRLGGVLDANTLDKIRGLEVDAIGLKPEDSLLDAMFANPTLGIILALKKNMQGCAMPDVDVDQDGIEAFCDTDPSDEVYVVDKCIDGNGKVVLDEVDAQGNVVKHCTEATDSAGNLLFVDGVSVLLKFEAVPATLER